MPLHPLSSSCSSPYVACPTAGSLYSSGWVGLPDFVLVSSANFWQKVASVAKLWLSTPPLQPRAQVCLQHFLHPHLSLSVISDVSTECTKSPQIRKEKNRSFPSGQLELPYFSFPLGHASHFIFCEKTFSNSTTQLFSPVYLLRQLQPCCRIHGIVSCSHATFHHSG